MRSLTAHITLKKYSLYLLTGLPQSLHPFQPIAFQPHGGSYPVQLKGVEHAAPQLCGPVTHNTSWSVIHGMKTSYLLRLYLERIYPELKRRL